MPSILFTIVSYGIHGKQRRFRDLSLVLAKITKGDII